MRLHTRKIKQLLVMACMPCIMSCTKNVATTPSNAFITIIDKIDLLATINGKKFMVDENQNPLYTYYYMQVNAGSNSFKLLNTITKKIVFDTNFVFLKDTYYTVLVYDSAQTVKTILVKDILPKPIIGKSYFRLFNLDKNVDTCNVSFNNKLDKAVIPLSGNIISELAKPPSFISLPSGTRFFVRRTLKDKSSREDVDTRDQLDYIRTIVIYDHMDTNERIWIHDHFKL